MPPGITPPVTVEIDIPVTRRTKVHAVVDGDGEQVFHSRRITQVFKYLIENEVTTFELLDEDEAFHFLLAFSLAPSQAPKG